MNDLKKYTDYSDDTDAFATTFDGIDYGSSDYDSSDYDDDDDDDDD